MNYKKIFLSTCIIFISYTYSSAQNYPYKFGKVSLDEMEMENCSFYPDANSMILAENGNLKMTYSMIDGWKYILKTVVRKKIFSSEDSDAGNIRLRIYTPENSSSSEEVRSFKAFSYNLIDGKVHREKINFKDVHERKISRNISEVNYIIPNIKDGTVIEYEYEKRSDYISNLSTWYFQQTDIPVAYSAFSYTIPEWFNYQINQLGTPIKGDWKSSSKSENFTIRYKTDNDSNRFIKSASKMVNNQIYSKSKYRIGVFKNIKPITEEPYTANLTDIPARIEFQLISINFPNQPIDVIAGDYEKFNKELMDNTSFGKLLSKGDFLGDSFGATIKNKTPLERAILIHGHLQKVMNWNNSNGYFNQSSFKSMYKDKEGSVADINLGLIAAYKANGLSAYPVILSTRGHGTPHPLYPNYNEFNYVIAFLEIDGKEYFIDATSSLPFGELPIKCRNSKGWLVNEKSGKWLDLKSQSNYVVKSLINIKFIKDSLKIDITQRRSNYAGYTKIDEFNKINKDELHENIQNEFINYKLNNVTSNITDYNSPITIHYKFSKAINEKGVIYLSPLIMGVIKENPFIREDRTAPIDFPYQQLLQVSLNIEIPDGYIAELPEGMLIKLPNEGGEFRFDCNQSGNKITLNSSFKMQETFFNTSNYKQIKEFYDLVSNKNNELIILTKI